MPELASDGSEFRLTDPVLPGPLRERLEGKSSLTRTEHNFYSRAVLEDAVFPQSLSGAHVRAASRSSPTGQ